MCFKYDSFFPAVVKAPGMDMLKVSLSKPRDTVEHISIWNWNGSALDEGARAAEWFSNYLGKTSRMVRFDAGIAGLASIV